MAALAQKLCEAVENEDAKEVENLLNCGADPNLVLPDGIAPIHLASGKESESALRCLTLILQQGGNPNVRSIEELTPVHVAASWGCCKALIFLLRKGGDPSVQDQDGNTALDLALMEKNRRCVVALQEYERNRDVSPERRNDYNSSYNGEIPEISSITLLLESACEISPCSSTKISPFVSAPKNGTTEKDADDAVLASHIEMLGIDSRSRPVQPYEDNCAVLKGSELSSNDNIVNSSNDSRTEDSILEGSVLTLQTCPDVLTRNYSSNHANSNILHEKLPIKEYKNSLNVSNVSVTPRFNSSVHDNMAIRTGKTCANSLLTHSSKLIDSQFTLKEWEGLDVTSPDHVFTYSRVHNDSNMENTLVLPKADEDRCFVDQETSSSSTYTSCFSDEFTTIKETTSASQQAGLDSDKCKALLDSNSNQVSSQNIAVLDKKTNSNVISVMNVEESLEGADNTLQEIEVLNNEELPSTSSHILNGKQIVLSNQNILVNGHKNEPVKTTETLFTSQSATLPAGDTTAHESCSQDLRTRLKNLLLSTKVCGEPVEHDSLSLAHCSPKDQPYFSTVPIREKNTPSDQNLKNVSSTCLNTLVVESANCEAEGELDTELCDLKRMMLATKVIHPVPPEEKSPCFFTERTRKRLLSSMSRHSNSSLFDESLEMPQRGRRLKSPDNKSRSQLPSAEARESKNESILQNCVEKNNICLVGTPTGPKENVSEPESTVNISNFLTDDLSSSENEQKSLQQFKKTSRDLYIESRVCDSMWLTEDGDTESSEKECHKFAELGSNQQDLSVDSQTGSFLHSTLNHDKEHSTKGSRYSFSRLSCVPKADETGLKLATVPDSVVEEVHLSPGGRPVNITHCEPVEYLYMDNDKGHSLVERHIPCIDQSAESSNTSDDTIIYDWRNYSSCKEKITKDSPACTTNRVAVELYRLSNDEIARRLRGLGEDPGEVNSKTRRVCILLLDKRLKEQGTNGPVGLSLEYSPELTLALRTYTIPDCNNDEASLSREFDQPDKTRKWREGVLKSSFNYLLLDPRVTRNLPSRCYTLSPPECFRIFVRAVFYVGKGKRARPYSHLYESLTHYKGNNKQPCSKVKHIVDIWRSGQGVLSLHCFQNTIPVEAYTREACMVDAIGLKMLTNQKKGVYYGQAQNWAPTRQRRLGVHMLHRAMQIFLAEGERQLRPPDIRTGP